MNSARGTDRIGSSFVLGLVLIAAGVSSLLERAHVFASISIGQWWPLLVVVIGLAKLSGRPEERRRGWMFLGIGGWCLVVALTPLTFSDTWPLLLMLWGGSMIWCGLEDAAGPLADGRENSHAS
jgi:LiaF transmembrane domain